MKFANSTVDKPSSKSIIFPGVQFIAFHGPDSSLNTDTRNVY